MTLEEAKAELRRLDDEHEELCPKQGPFCAQEDVELDQIRRLQENRQRRRSLGCEFASYPHLREHMWCWMVDVNGRESNMTEPGDFVEGMELLVSDNPAEFAARAGGALMQEVREFVTSELGRPPTDSGGGLIGWHIGTPCNQSEMEGLTSALHWKFAGAIKAGILTVQVKYWGWRFRAEES